MTGVFPSVYTQNCKINSCFLKGSKLDYSIYHSISLLSNNYEKNTWKTCIEEIVYLSHLNNNNNLQFGFRQQYSTSHTLINITKNMRKALYDGNIGCGVFGKSFWYFRPPDNFSKIESLWDLWSLKQLV